MALSKCLGWRGQCRSQTQSPSKHPIVHAFARGPELIARVENLLAATSSRVGDEEVDRAMAAPLVNPDELSPKVFGLGNRFHDIEPIDSADMPRRVSQFVAI